MRGLALQDAGLAVGLLDQSSDFAVVLNMRLDERSFENARQRLAAILTRYGKAIFDTPHPVAQRADLAAMIGTSRVMMYRALRGAGSRRSRETPTRRRHQHPGRGATGPTGYGGAPGRRSGSLRTWAVGDHLRSSARHADLPDDRTKAYSAGAVRHRPARSPNGNRTSGISSRSKHLVRSADVPSARWHLVP